MPQTQLLYPESSQVSEFYQKLWIRRKAEHLPCDSPPLHLCSSFWPSPVTNLLVLILFLHGIWPMIPEHWLCLIESLYIPLHWETGLNLPLTGQALYQLSNVSSFSKLSLLCFSSADFSFIFGTSRVLYSPQDTALGVVCLEFSSSYFSWILLILHCSVVNRKSIPFLAEWDLT